MEDKEKSLSELQQKINEYMDEVNSLPRKEMDNLSTQDMFFILHKTFEDGSPIQFKPAISNEIIEQIPFYILFRKYLDKINDETQLKLTARGNLPRKICLELYDTGIIKEEMIEKGIVKLNKEADSVVMQNLKIIGLLSGITKKRNNKISLTKMGKDLYGSKDQSPLFRKVFETNAFKFNLGYHDGYPQESQVQSVIGYTIYLLLKYGKEKRDITFYVDKNLEAFPQLPDDFGSNWSTPKESYSRCYHIRIFERFLSYYGFVLIDQERIRGMIDGKIEIRATDLFRKVLEIKKESFKFKKARHEA